MFKPQTVPTCSYCHAPHGDLAEICQDCTTLLRSLLRQAPFVLAELDVTLSRQTKIGSDTAGRRSSETPLPFDYAASEATDVLLAGTLTRWALDIWRHAQMIAGQSWVRPDLPDPIQYLLERVDQIRFRSWAAAMLDEVQSAIDNAWATVDLAAAYLEAGVCSCNTRLQARPDRPVVVCRTCGATYDVRDRREAMVVDAENRWLPAKEIERLVDIFLRIGASDRVKRRIPSGSVRGWASKGEISMKGFATDGRSPTYRLGDVFDRAFREVTEAAAA